MYHHPVARAEAAGSRNAVSDVLAGDHWLGPIVEGRGFHEHRGLPVQILNGITRKRVINLLRADGVTVVEKTLGYQDFQGADEIFSSGNFAKVAPIIRIDDRSLQPGPFYSRARKLYWEFAHA